MTPHGMSGLKVYLAGPDVFLADARDVLRAKQELCAEAGFVGLSPLDGDPAFNAEAIFRNCEAAMDAADLIVANMTPFRGAGMDAGTAYEVGYMRARGKPVFAYSNAPGDYADRVEGSRPGPDGAKVDGLGQIVEDFGLAENLMLACAAAAFGAPILTPDTTPADPLRGEDDYERKLDAARRWRDRPPSYR